MRTCLLVIAVVLSAPLFASAQERYIVVVVNRSAPDAAGSTAAAARRLGGAVEAELGDRLIVLATPAAIAELRKLPAVRYIQDTASQEPRTAAAIEAPVQVHSGQTWSSKTYTYDGAGNIASVGTSANAGTQGYRTYGYDRVSRLARAQIGGVTPAHTYEYEYDVYGNRTQQALDGQWMNVAVDAATNRLVDGTYDVSGNQLTRGATSATYDGFGMITRYRFDGTNELQYVYTASDERIGVKRGNEWTWSLRGADGKVLRQYRSSHSNPSASWLWVEDFVYRDSLLLGSERVPEEGGRRHDHLDHLGSPRLITGAAGSLISEHDFLPFGEERTEVDQHVPRGYDREEPLRFTAHERDFDIAKPNDSSAFIDYMHARYYSPGTGRFLSVDPIIPSAAVKEPQRWNRYSYVINNPMRFTDPTGKLFEVRAGACSDTNRDCYTRLQAFTALQSWVGKDAAKYLQMGKNGQITLKGISASAFAKFGSAAGTVANLIRSTDRTAAFALSSDAKDGAYTSDMAGGTLTKINPAAFPNLAGGVAQTLDTAMAHSADMR